MTMDPDPVAKISSKPDSRNIEARADSRNIDSKIIGLKNPADQNDIIVITSSSDEQDKENTIHKSKHFKNHESLNIFSLRRATEKNQNGIEKVF